MSKNVVFWIGVKNKNQELISKGRYGDFEWMDYSKQTWKYWCKKNDVEFIEYTTPSNPDILNYRVTWQRYIDVYDYIENRLKDYNQILLTDASIMIKWDAENIFNKSDHKFCGFRGDENMSWLYDSISGYQDLFPNQSFNWDRIIMGGLTLFNKSHKLFFNTFKEFFNINYSTLMNKQNNTVKKGTDQPVLNWLLQREKIDVKFLNRKTAINHLYRFNLLDLDSITQRPLFIDNVDLWIFSGFPDRGNTRTSLMKQTWDIVKENYE